MSRRVIVYKHRPVINIIIREKGETAILPSYSNVNTEIPSDINEFIKNAESLIFSTQMTFFKFLGEGPQLIFFFSTSNSNLRFNVGDGEDVKLTNKRGNIQIFMKGAFDGAHVVINNYFFNSFSR